MSILEKFTKVEINLVDKISVVDKDVCEALQAVYDKALIALKSQEQLISKSVTEQFDCTQDRSARYSSSDYDFVSSC